MSDAPIPERTPTEDTERALANLRREAMEHGAASGRGLRPDGAPFPIADREIGYYGTPARKKPVWTWEVPVYFYVGGAAGAAAIIAALASRSGGRSTLARDATRLAA